MSETIIKRDLKKIKKKKKKKKKKSKSFETAISWLTAYMRFLVNCSSKSYSLIRTDVVDCKTYLF